MCALDIRPAIATDRLVLRGPVAADAPQIAELAADGGVAAMTAKMPHPYGLADAEAFVARCQAADANATPTFAIQHREFGVIGALGFDARADGRPEVGYWLGRPFWGRGYATEALKAALVWAKAGWGRNAVWAGHFADNRASASVLIKAGFLYTGDVERPYSVARGDVAPTRMMVWLA
ncbi:MAG: GNAT family N-acetyltransferase [Phenylobacterium sp.]|uniref:GNAT family N-acetyltransferase n=1 Tax=Phenylobacterium sp. TaxID=1871053 RepID=UPI001A378DA3|nr:GNAT family N-acetyltransferase [Phenylobacterium sp.]MBL8773660.1 GNAT family N-acetyltransferase [Phenylobacterium sp.]